MNEKLKKLLKKLGLDDQVIDSFESEDEKELKKIDVDAVAKTVNDNMKSALENDSDFINDVEQRIRGKLLSAKERKIMKQFGVTKDEFDELPETNKFDALIELIGKKVEEKGGTPDDKDKEILKLRAELSKKDDEVKKFTEEIIPSKEREFNERLTRRDYEVKLRKLVSKHKILIDEEDAAEIIDKAIRKNYDIKFDGDNIKVMQKGKELEAFENNKPVAFNDLIKKTIDEKKLARKSNAGIDDDPEKKGGRGRNHEDEPDVNLPGLQKAKSHEKQMMKQKASSDSDDE